MCSTDDVHDRKDPTKMPQSTAVQRRCKESKKLRNSELRLQEGPGMDATGIYLGELTCGRSINHMGNVGC